MSTYTLDGHTGNQVNPHFETAQAKLSLEDIARHPDSAVLQDNINAFLKRVQPADVRQVMTHIFAQLIRLLDDVRTIDAASRDGRSIAETLNLLDGLSIPEKSLALVNYIETQALSVIIDEPLFDALGSTSYAIKHEIKRVFEEELKQLNTRDPAYLICGQVARVVGLLQNCFEQSIMTLAQFFDPSFNSALLLNDYQTRLEQSHALCKDLMELIELVRRAEKDRNRNAIASLAKHLKMFRHQSMHYLMYKDWEECEQFVKRVLTTNGDSNLVVMLDRFSCYLEVLLTQVKLRAVLQAPSL